VALVSIAVASAARATTYTESCSAMPDAPGATPVDESAIETRELRRELVQLCRVLVERLGGLDVHLHDVDGSVDAVEAAVAGAHDETLDGSVDAVTAAVQGLEGDPTAGSVELVTEDRQRLDLTWWGTWATVGLLMCLLFVPVVMRSFQFWRGDE
jgi:hypothetical protein